VPAVDPAMRLDDLGERQHRVDHWPQLSPPGQRHERSIVIGAD
jgi:hypothetical protein